MREESLTVSVQEGSSINGNGIGDDDGTPLMSPSMGWEFAGWGSIHRIENVVPPDENNSQYGGRHSTIDIKDEEYTYGKEDAFVVKMYKKLRGRNNNKAVRLNTAGAEGSDSMGSIDHDFEAITMKDAGERHAENHKLGQWKATSIAGNDITSSCLYVAGLATIAGGKFAPLSLLLVVSMLYLFRSIYGEVGSALPMNGGSYTVLLNTTTKLIGSLAACLTLLSYIATAVISASSSADYFISLTDVIPKELFTIGVLAVFMILNLIGLSESANVALVIFIIHMVTLSVVVAYSAYAMFADLSILQNNWYSPPIRNVPLDIFFGFCSGLLGVTGFESSANYIEEQKEGVFPKTLRNMWIAVAIFNPLISFTALGVLPLSTIVRPEVSNSLVSAMGNVAAGGWLKTWVIVDATMVLCGSVLTSYVGVTGLVRRMTLDRCLPQVFISENRITKTPHFIIIGFFLVTTSLYVITGGKTSTLAGVYSISFLSVMSLFAVGNMLLKYKRGQIPRDVRANWGSAMVALFAVVAGVIGTIVYTPSIVEFFGIYFVVTVVIVFSMFLRIRIMKILLYFLSKTVLDRYIGKWIRKQVKAINMQSVIFFAKSADLAELNKAVLYVRDNELTDCMKIVHVYDNEKSIPDNMATHISVLDRIYPKIRIDLVLVKGDFCPHVVARLAKRMEIPQNFMFIACPGKSFPNKIGQYGGVRVITH